jgi:D-alanyl-D-alanine carboxypeptidase
MRKHKKLLVALLLLIVVLTAAGLYYAYSHRHHAVKTQDNTVYTSKNATPQPVAQPAPTGFNKKQYSIDDSASLWVVVDKLRPLKAGYIPANLVTPAVALRLSSGVEEMKMRQDAGNALVEMFTAAKTAGLPMLIASGYRSEVTQKALHASYVAQKGAAAADTDSARAGYSEHQTGLAVDVGRTDHKCEVDPCFANTAEGQWVAANAYKYGFIVRYPQNKQAITGYIYEPWHIRYVGKDLAKAVYDSGQTLEEFFELPAAPDYR